MSNYGYDSPAGDDVDLPDYGGGYGGGDDGAGGTGGGGGYDYGNFDYTGASSANGTGGGNNQYGYASGNFGNGGGGFGYTSGNFGDNDDDADLLGLGSGGGGQDFYGMTKRNDDPDPEPEVLEEEAPNAEEDKAPESPLKKKKRKRKKTIQVVKEIGIPLEDDPMVADELRALRKHHLFQNVYWNDYYKIATRWLDRFRIAKDTVLAKQGSSAVGGTHYCIISKGLVEVQRNGIALSSLGPGDTFGENQMLYSQPAAATLVCSSYVEAWGLSKEVYERVKSAHQVARRRAGEDGEDEEDDDEF